MTLLSQASLSTGTNAEKLVVRQQCFEGTRELMLEQDMVIRLLHLSAAKKGNGGIGRSIEDPLGLTV